MVFERFRQSRLSNSRRDDDLIEIDTPPEKGRFKYRPFKKRPKLRKYYIIAIIAAIILVILTIFWWWPAWYAGINLNSQLYNNKAGGLNFMEHRFLNYWSNFFFFNKSALIGALIGSIIMSFPPDRILLTAIGTKLRFGKPSRKKALLFWWTAGFAMFYGLGFLIDMSGQFSWNMYLVESGEIDFNPFTLIFDAFNVLMNSNNIDISSIYIYQSLYVPIINFIIGVLMFRASLKILQNIYIRRNDYQVLMSSLFIVSLLFGLIFFNIPMLPLDGIQITQIWTFIIGFFSLMALSLILFIYGKIKLSENPRNYILFGKERRKVIIMSIITLFVIIIPLFISIGPTINLSNASVYEREKWVKKINRQIEWTHLCAGLDIFEERPIQNFTDSTNATNDDLMIKQIRQYDQTYAVKTLSAKIGTTYEGLADSDIVYINGTEYWVAPKTIRIAQFSGDPVAIHTELYDHVEGIMAIDTFNGTLVNITNTFNISESYPIFFGESESSKFLIEQGLSTYGRLGAYDSDILLDTDWSGGIEKNVHVYNGTPDGTLSGLEGFWYTTGMGLWGYSSKTEYNFLINRNVKKRVGNILLPNMKIDSDPYMVFDQMGKMYYAVSIYTSIEIGSYSATPIYRFLGVCLVDVENGLLEFYGNPALEASSADPTFPLWQLYVSRYNWQIAPNWLLEQMRYPEDLFELQLEANYIYHVRDLKSWKRGDDFQERPEDGDLFYIETILGDGIVEFVGLDIVEYRGLDARTLAGMYVMRHGTNLGEAIFYHTRDLGANQLIGPQTARDSYISEASQDITLIQDPSSGNILIYPLLNSIYYYIPTYSNVGGIQNLNLAGFVEGFSRDVGYGEGANEAYEDLGKFPPTAFTLTSNAVNPDRDGKLTLSWTESEYTDSYFLYQNDTLVEEIDSSELSYFISNLSDGYYNYQLEAENEYGTITSNNHLVNVSLIPISYDFFMDDSLGLPNDLAQIRVEIENFNSDYLAGPVENISVILKLYTTHDDLDLTLHGLDDYSINSSLLILPDYYEINYTLINNTNLLSGRGIILNGWLNSTRSDIVIHYVWILLIQDIELYVSDVGDIIVSSEI
ncbi:MAG: UPF0182 family protein [Candidatus Lokiarchaeota archaeon]|nr:UPF0182 family protein [Candidatus Lokiarchaeota archaeon]